MTSILPLTLENIRYHHDNNLQSSRTEALKDITIRFDTGIKTIILGPNGAGKSILLKVCHGLLRPSAGKIHWNNISPAVIRQKQAMVFTKPSLLNRSVRENLLYVLKLHNKNREELNQQAKSILEEFGLLSLSERNAHQLSTGEQHRLSFALALSFRPEILFLDEPTANLDPKATATIERLVAEANSQGTTIVMTTHDLMQARRIADRIIFIEDGKVIEQTDARIFFENPQSTEAQDFLSGRIA